MANYWAIEIGVHQYRFLPPLSYAQRDAELLHRFLIQMGGFSSRHCVLLADSITVTLSDPSFPLAKNILGQLARLCQEVKPQDVLLCFFSGYGLKFHGQDYLLPIEAEPPHLTTTAIAVESLVKTLKTAATQNIVLILDANRSEFHGEQGGFGEEVVELGRAHQMAVLLSCQPQQFSHEPLTLRQGVFTSALVAALQEGLTLEQVVDCLREKLPKLSEECWRPRQDLVAIVPPHLRHQLLLPRSAQSESHSSKATVPQVWLNGLHRGMERVTGALSQSWARLTQPTVTQPSLIQPNLIQSSATLPQATAYSTYSTSTYSTESRPQKHHAEFPTALLAAEVSSGTTTLLPARPAALGGDPLTLSDEFFWRRLLVQSGLVGCILLVGVALRNSGAFMGASGLTRSTSKSSVESTAPISQSNIPAAVPQVTAGPLPTSPPIDPLWVLQSAQAAFTAQQYEEANRLLTQIPIAQRPPEHHQLLEQTNREVLNQAKTMLIRPRQMMPENQASDLVEAIKVARLIQPDQPLYLEAQENIERWSRVIMDMAQGRAERPNESSVLDAAENYSLAIAAARLIPGDRAKVKAQAQEAITLWSQMILNLATDRAAKGELDLAIQIGELVPPNTPIYPQALESIASWRNQPSPDPIGSDPMPEPAFTEASDSTAYE